MTINHYPDKTSYVESTELGKQVFRINSYDDLWKLGQFVDASRSRWKNENGESIRPNIIIPNLLDGQADRRFEKGQSFGLKQVLKFLGGLEANFEIFHPHNPESVEIGMELLDNPVEIMDNSQFIKKVLSIIGKGYEDVYEVNNPVTINQLENMVIMSPDAGMYKYMGKICDKINWKGDFISASKIRKWENNESKLIQQLPDYDFEGKDVLLTDDLLIFGGTMKGLSKMLKERNCGKLYLAASHMTVQDLGTNPVTDYFDTVFTTNSKFEEYYSYDNNPPQDIINYPNNLEIIKLF